MMLAHPFQGVARMMLARVADSLYWLGRYIERAEHLSRLSSVMLNATLDQTDSGVQAVWIALSAVGEPEMSSAIGSFEAAEALVLDRSDANSVVSSLARARENARQVRDQITTETWERLNLLYLKVTDRERGREFADGSTTFLHDIIADLHLFKGAADTTMSHGESWRFMMLGMYLERAQLIAPAGGACFAEDRPAGRSTTTSPWSACCAWAARWSRICGSTPPRSSRGTSWSSWSSTRTSRAPSASPPAQIEASQRSGPRNEDRWRPERIAGRLKARLEFADIRTGDARRRRPADHRRQRMRAHPRSDLRDLRGLPARNAPAPRRKRSVSGFGARRNTPVLLEIRHVTQYHYERPSGKASWSCGCSPRRPRASGWSASSWTSSRPRRCSPTPTASATPSITSTCRSRTTA
jgi:hypothetical protein